MRRVARLTFTAVALLVAMPATAPAAPDERTAARAFADAARIYTKAVWDSVPAVRADIAARGPDLRSCGRLDLDPVADAPRRLERALEILVEAHIAPVFVPMAAAREQFVAALDRVPTEDRALRSGRAAWRVSLPAMRGLASIPPDACARLLAWAAGGYRGLPLPELQVTDLDEVNPDEENPAGGDAKVVVAAQRMRALGQGPRRAERFTGFPAFDAVWPIVSSALDDLLGGLS